MHSHAKIASIVKIVIQLMEIAQHVTQVFNLQGKIVLNVQRTPSHPMVISHVQLALVALPAIQFQEYASLVQLEPSSTLTDNVLPVLLTPTP